jgi:pectate lyase
MKNRILLNVIPHSLPSVLLSTWLSLGCMAAEPRPASLFPAQKVGWTRTKGGEGAEIVRVTSLAARGPGSLGDALAKATPRHVVFEVGGVIDLERKSYSIKSPFITIAGESAPAPGITMIRGGINIGTHDVVIQHLSIRPGEAGRAKKSGWEVDGISTSTGAHDVIVDHCSITWSTDENLSASGERFGGGTENPEDWRGATSHRITFSNNLIAQGLSQSTHGKGEHSKGSLIHDNATDIAIVGNLYAANMERNPLFKGGARGVVVNNLIANPGRYFVHYGLVASEWGSHAYQTGQVAIVGNVAIGGPVTRSAKSPTALFILHGDGPCEVYLADNELPLGLAPGATRNPAQAHLLQKRDQPPTWPAGFVALPPAVVREQIVREVGARPWDRDPIDQRIVKEALAGTVRIIDSESQAESYPKRPATQKK